MSKLADRLKEIAAKAERSKEVKVGFVSGATYPDGTPVAMVAAIQNFGAPEAGIPPRPFFTLMVETKKGEWPKQLGDVLKTADFDSDLALSRMGMLISGELQQSIRDTNDPALSEATIKAKGFEKPLVDSGHMLNSVQWQVDDAAPEESA